MQELGLKSSLQVNGSLRLYCNSHCLVQRFQAASEAQVGDYNTWTHPFPQTPLVFQVHSLRDLPLYWVSISMWSLGLTLEPPTLCSWWFSCLNYPWQRAWWPRLEDPFRNPGTILPCISKKISPHFDLWFADLFLHVARSVPWYVWGLPGQGSVISCVRERSNSVPQSWEVSLPPFLLLFHLSPFFLPPLSPLLSLPFFPSAPILHPVLFSIS